MYPQFGRPPCGTDFAGQRNPETQHPVRSRVLRPDIDHVFVLRETARGRAARPCAYRRLVQPETASTVSSASSPPRGGSTSLLAFSVVILAQRIPDPVPLRRYSRRMSGCPAKRTPKKSYTSRSLSSAVPQMSLTVGSTGFSRSVVKVLSTTQWLCTEEVRWYTTPNPISGPSSTPVRLTR